MTKTVGIALDRTSRSRDAFMWTVTHFLNKDDNVVLIAAAPEFADIVGVGGLVPGVPLVLHDDYQAELQDVDKLLEKYSGYCRLNDINCSVKRVLGPPGDVIMPAAVKCGVDALVVGNSGKTGVDRFLIGSTSESLVHQAPFPVVVIKTTHSVIHAADRPRKIVVAVDATPFSSEAFNWLADHVIREHDEVFVVHADTHHKPPPAPSPTRKTTPCVAGDVARKYAAMCEERGMTFFAMDVRGGKGVAESLATVVRSLNADLLVTGCKRAGFLRRALFGSVSDGLIRNCTCDVLVVKTSPSTSPTATATTAATTAAEAAATDTADDVAVKPEEGQDLIPKPDNGGGGEAEEEVELKDGVEKQPVPTTKSSEDEPGAADDAAVKPEEEQELIPTPDNEGEEEGLELKGEGVVEKQPVPTTKSPEDEPAVPAKNKSTV